MFKRFLSEKNSKKGFTLIELLVVIAIIGILASIVLASLNTARRKSRDARRVSDVKQLQNALELCFDAGSSCGNNTATEYPEALSELAGATSTFIAAIPTDPVSAAAYDYFNILDGAAGGTCDAAADDCISYHLGTVLEESSNVALDNDADKEPVADWEFDGNDADCDTTDGAGTDACYDLTP